MSVPVVHFEILGKDGKKLQEFYHTLFGWRINADNPMNYGIVEKVGEGIGGGIGTPQEGMAGYVTVYAEVDDISTYLKKVEELGGKVVVPETEIPNMVTFALFQDIEGNMMGLVKSEK